MPDIRRSTGRERWVVTAPVRDNTGTMSNFFRAIAVISIMVLTGCAADNQPLGAGGSVGSDAPTGPILPTPPLSGEVPGEVLGQGTVLQVGDGPPLLCLGPVMESYPPQCGGPEIVGWDWVVAGQFESAADTTWGGYAVQGTWDGTRLTVTAPPIPLSLFDPAATPDPFLDEGNAGATNADRLAFIQDEVHKLNLPGYVGSWAMNGYVFVDVVHDVKPVQVLLDGRYGPGVAVVRAGLKPIG